MTENETPLAETLVVVEAPRRNYKKIALIAAATTAAAVTAVVLSRRPEVQNAVENVADAVTPTES